MAKSGEDVFGPEIWAHLQDLRKRGYLDALESLAKYLTAPIHWTNPTTGELQGGTVCFVHTGVRILGISAAHIHDTILDLRKQTPGLHCQVGGHTFDPQARLVSIDRAPDLVTYDFTEVSTNAVGANINSPPIWPPRADDGDTVLVCGWPWHLSTPGQATNDFKFLHFIAKLQKNSDTQFGIATFTAESVAWGDHSLPRGTNLGGMSGGPVFRLIETPFTRLELVGIVYEYQPTYELVLASSVALVAADGTIGGHPPAAGA